MTASSESPSLRKLRDRKSTRLNSSHLVISYAVFCLKKKKKYNVSPINHNNETSHAREHDLSIASHTRTPQYYGIVSHPIRVLPDYLGVASRHQRQF